MPARQAAEKESAGNNLAGAEKKVDGRTEPNPSQVDYNRL